MSRGWKKKKVCIFLILGTYQHFYFVCLSKKPFLFPRLLIFWASAIQMVLLSFFVLFKFWANKLKMKNRIRGPNYLIIISPKKFSHKIFRRPTLHIEVNCPLIVKEQVNNYYFIFISFSSFVEYM